MDLRKYCCPGRHTPTLYSSALAVAPTEGLGTYQQASADHQYTGVRRSPLLPDNGTTGHRKVEIPAPPPTVCHSAHSPVHSDLIAALAGREGGEGVLSGYISHRLTTALLCQVGGELCETCADKLLPKHMRFIDRTTRNVGINSVVRNQRSLLQPVLAFHWRNPFCSVMVTFEMVNRMLYD